MSKKKDVQAMVKTLCCLYGTTECDTCADCCSLAENCEKLYDAGYCKADEVRKKTAKEILDLLIRYDDGDSNSEAIKLIIDHYGLKEYIEVDE